MISVPLSSKSVIGSLICKPLPSVVFFVVSKMTFGGRGTALAFARGGARTVVADVNQEGGNETVRLIKEIGGEGVFIKADVSQGNEVEKLINQTMEMYNRLDFAFNNAGVAVWGTSADSTETDWDRVISVNLKGVWLCMKYEILQMRKAEGGCIVNTASVLGLKGASGLTAYVASKHGVVGLTKAAALECAGDGIRINAICPGWIKTTMTESISEEQMADQTPINRAGEPEDVAGCVIWLCSDAASFVTGHAMVVDGGMVAK